MSQPTIKNVRSGPTDKNIRNALVERLQVLDPAARIVHELPLSRGERRADVAHVNGRLCGYEIKSCRDSVFRLPGQIEAYGSVFEYMTAVVAPCHLKSVRDCLPATWGIMTVEQDGDDLVFESVRQSRKNRHQQKSALIRLLWKDECISILRANGCEIPRSALIIDIWQEMEQLPIELISEKVKAALKSRSKQA